MTSLEIDILMNNIETILSNYKTDLDYYLDEEFGKMTEEEIRNSEDNLETAVDALLGEIEKTNNCINQLKYIKYRLKVLDIFTQYISLNYIKNLISENEFSLNNFDWDIKDEKCLTNRIKQLNILAEFLKAYKEGNSNDR